ncbi:hypothetical protein V6N11_079612 [Hibiscus sabdariffa]|uniref:Uncharacterized protein n=1 Tax=Hibiscus sabdariffa TaxID=183260 RepID=A0ABR2RW05_9ROSI
MQAAQQSYNSRGQSTGRKPDGVGMNTIGGANGPIGCGGEEGVFEGCGADGQTECDGEEGPVEVGIGGGWPARF